MSILFTGSSSFTGYHFLKEINKNKIKTFAIFSKKKKKYKNKNQKEILNSKLKYIIPYNNVKFGTEKYIKIIQKEKIKTICFHHFIVGELNKKYYFNKNIKKLIWNIERVISELSLNKNSLVIYTSSIYQKISSNLSYIKDKSRIDYGFTKLILSQVLRFICKKYKVKFINFELHNPIGVFEKKNTLPFDLALSFFKKKNIKLNNPKRVFKYQFIEKISKDYVKIIQNQKNLKSIYIKKTVSEFKDILFKQFKKNKEKKSTTFFWSNYYNYYEQLNELY